MRFHFSLLSLVFLCAGIGAVAQTPSSAPTCANLHLVPAPRECTAVTAVPVDQSGVRVLAERNADDEFAAKDLDDALKSRGVPMWERNGGRSPAGCAPTPASARN